MNYLPSTIQKTTEKKKKKKKKEKKKKKKKKKLEGKERLTWTWDGVRAEAAVPTQSLRCWKRELEPFPSFYCFSFVKPIVGNQRRNNLPG